MRLLKLSLISILFILVQGSRPTVQNSYSDDLHILVKTLQQLHPDLYNVIGKNRFDSLLAETNGKIGKASSKNEVLYCIQYFLFQFGDGHLSTLNAFIHPYGEKILPFKVAIIENELYIRSFPSDSAFEGAHIITINGTKGSILIDSLRVFYTNDGARKLSGNGLQALFNSLYAAFCREPDIFLIETDRGLLQTASIHKGEKYYDELIAYNWLDSSFAKPVFDCNGNYGYCRFNDFEKKSGGLEPEKEFNAFMSKMISMHKPALVIDLRYNGGGLPCMAARLASWFTDTAITPFQRVMLTDSHHPEFKEYLDHDWQFSFRRMGTKQEDSLLKKIRFDKSASGSYSSKQHYEGKVYVLVSDITASAATMFCAFLSKKTNVEFVGSETGGAINYFWAHKLCELHLPASGVDVIFPLELLELEKGSSSISKPKPLVPDIPIHYTIGDYLSGIDKEVEWVNNEIRK